MWSVDRFIRMGCGVLMSLSALLLFSCEKSVRPVLGELVVDSVAHDVVYCHVEVIEGMPDESTFYYGITKSAVEKSTSSKVQGAYGASVIEATINGLKPNTIYYLRASAMNSSGRAYTETVSVVTVSRIPAVDDNGYPNVD